MKKKVRNVVDKLIHFSTQLENDYPIKGGSTIQSIKEFFLGYSKVVQSGLEKLDIDDQGIIDWQTGGVYAFAKESTKKTWVVLSPSDDLSECTHIVHKPSGIGKQLALFGVQEIHKNACFVNNHCQIKTQVSNGGRVKFDLFEDYKNDEFFKYEDRFSKEQTSDEWKKIAGVEVKSARAVAKKRILEVKEALADAKKELGVGGGKAAGKGVRKRMRVA